MKVQMMNKKKICNSVSSSWLELKIYEKNKKEAGREGDFYINYL